MRKQVEESPELVAELPVERFVGGILPRLFRGDQRRVNARVTEPAQDGGGHELRCPIASAAGRRAR